ncbi:MAG TPA: hypothetical protein VFC78_07285 [Tepidisphaeraceae bacterium]|nr:hypothetical protein [Tepidisphaeraceae bacterium]
MSLFRKVKRSIPYVLCVAGSFVVAPALSLCISETLLGGKDPGGSDLYSFHCGVCCICSIVLAMLSVYVYRLLAEMPMQPVRFAAGGIREQYSVDYESARCRPRPRFGWGKLVAFIGCAAAFLLAVWMDCSALPLLGFDFLGTKLGDSLLNVAKPGMKMYWHITAAPAPFDVLYGFVGILFVWVVYSIVLGAVAWGTAFALYKRSA